MGDPICELCKKESADTVIATMSGKEYAVCEPCYALKCADCEYLGQFPSTQWKCNLDGDAITLNDLCPKFQIRTTTTSEGVNE